MKKPCTVVLTARVAAHKDTVSQGKPGGMLDRYSLPLPCSPIWRHLPLTQLPEQAFVWVDVNAAGEGTGGAAFKERADLWFWLSKCI